MPLAGTIPHDFPHFATGPTLVRCRNTIWETYELDLGYSEDRIQIHERPFWHEVKSDAYGGTEGPPCDVQYLGSIAIVTCLLNRFNEANLRLISTLNINKQALPSERVSPGVMPNTGLYMRQDLCMCELWLINKTYSLKYERAFLRNGRQFSVGTRHQSFALVFECHVNDPCEKVLVFYEEKDDPCS